MSMTLQVLYPINDSTTFDYEYYYDTHMKIVGEYIGEFIESRLVTKGLAGGPDTAPGYHAIATMVFADKVALDPALANAGAVLDDIPNFTNSEPEMLIGEVADL